MPELNWRLRVWTPTGSGPRIIQRDTGLVPIPGEASHIQGLGGRGLRLRITPEGECIEAVFSAKGSGILLPPLSAVQVEYFYLGNWTPLYYGEVRRGGNARDVFGEDYAIVGMSRRLEEVTLSPGFSAPEQAAHLTVRAIIQDVIARGQLGTPALVQYAESLCPDLGFNCRKIVDAAQQNPAALLKQIAEDGAKYGVIVRWGIDPQRRFFCRPAKSDTRDVTTEAPVITWTPPVAETPCTAVLWYVAKRPDGTWVTHTSRSPEAATYGDRVKALSVDASVNPWRVLSGTYEFWGRAEGGTAWESGSAFVPDPAIVHDGVTRPYSRSGAHNVLAGGDYSAFRFHGAEPVERLTYGLQTASSLIVVTPYIGVYDPAAPAGDGTDIAAGSDQGLSVGIAYMPPGALGVQVITKDKRGTDSAVGWQITEFRPEVIDTELLDGLAAFHYVSPAQEPADIQTVLFVPPVELPGRVRVVPPDGVPYEHPLEAVEYRITSNGMQMGWLAGQADDPDALAQASLIKRRDGEAVITSITAQT